MPKTVASIETLRSQFPWPKTQPDFPSQGFAWGISDEELLLSVLPSDVECILEIGSFLGGSASFFARHRPDANILCVDPWDDVSDRPFLNRAPELRDAFSQVDGCYKTFLSSTWEWRDQIIPIRGFSPEALRTVGASGCKPDFIYIDGAHGYEAVFTDLIACFLLFPDAVLSGDDWNWSPQKRPGFAGRFGKKRNFPVQQAVTSFANRYGFDIQSSKNTWVLKKDSSY